MTEYVIHDMVMYCLCSRLGKSNKNENGSGSTCLRRPEEVNGFATRIHDTGVMYIWSTQYMCVHCPPRIICMTCQVHRERSCGMTEYVICVVVMYHIYRDLCIHPYHCLSSRLCVRGLQTCTSDILPFRKMIKTMSPCGCVYSTKGSTVSLILSRQKCHVYMFDAICVLFPLLHLRYVSYQSHYVMSYVMM